MNRAGNTGVRHKDWCASCGYNPVVYNGKHHKHCWFVLKKVKGFEVRDDQ
jgi:hypothetical protein